MRIPSAVVSLALGLAVCLLGCRSTSEPGPLACSGAAATELYTRKIEPILKDDRPSSCNQCHLSGIDLSLFVRDTPCQTMACMNQLGLVDLATPASSKVLGWIERAKPQSALITADVIEAEYQGVLEWIEYASRCGSQVCPSFEDPCNQRMPAASSLCDPVDAGPLDFADPGDCSELTLEQLFAADVYLWRARCHPCHFTSDMSVKQAPKWITDVSIAQGDASRACRSSALETMRKVLEWGLVDLATPTQSLLLLKPLALQGGGVQHGGGPKFESANDPSYQTFLAWITRYAACAAQDPSLQKAAPAPPAVPVESSGHGDAGPPETASIYDYCNCMLSNCHDGAHVRWGESDEQLLANCRIEALNVPANGGPTMTGNFLECRAAYCAQGREDPDACYSAFGLTVCR